MTSSNPNYLSRAPLLSTITLGDSVSTYECEVGAQQHAVHDAWPVAAATGVLEMLFCSPLTSSMDSGIV